MSQTAWTVVTVIAVLGTVGMYAVLRRPIRQMDGLPPQLCFGYEKTAQPDQRFSLLFAVMLFFAGLAMAVVAHNATDILWMRHAMYALTVLGCAAGLAETLLVAAGKLRPASVCARAKWACFAVWTLGMFAGLLIRGWAL